MSSSVKSNIDNTLLKSNTHTNSPLKMLKISRSDETLSQITMANTIKVKNYELFKEIGRGAFGTVYLGRKINSDEVYAIKSLDKLFLSNTNKTHTALIEKEILRIAKHDSIIKLLTAFQTSSKLFFVLEYESNGSLQSLIDSFGSLSYQLSKFYLAEIVNVLSYLHNSLQVIHRDLKPENILLDANYHLKLIDFGSATIEPNSKLKQKPNQNPNDEKTKSLVDICNHSKSLNELVGTAEYCSPEMLNYNTVSSSSNDIWAFGCLMYLFFHGKTPFAGSCERETLANIKSGKFGINDSLPDDVKDLLQGVLEIDQIKRMTLEQIKAHEFFRDVNFDTITTAKVPVMIEDMERNLFKRSKGDTSSTIDSWITESNSNNEMKEKEKDKEFVIDVHVAASAIVLIDSYFNFDMKPIANTYKVNEDIKLLYEGIIDQVNWLNKVSSIIKLYSNKDLVLYNLKTNDETFRMNLNKTSSIELLPQKQLIKIITNKKPPLKLSSTIEELLKLKESIYSCTSIN